MVAAYETPGERSAKDDSYPYDDEGRLTSRTDAKGQASTYAHDSPSRRASRIAAAGLWTRTYDGDSSRVLTVISTPKAEAKPRSPAVFLPVGRGRVTP